MQIRAFHFIVAMVAMVAMVAGWLQGELWIHEIEVMDPQGGSFAMIRTGIDVVDIGTSCGL